MKLFCFMCKQRAKKLNICTFNPSLECAVSIYLIKILPLSATLNGLKNINVPAGQGDELNCRTTLLHLYTILSTYQELIITYHLPVLSYTHVLKHLWSITFSSISIVKTIGLPSSPPTIRTYDKFRTINHSKVSLNKILENHGRKS